jgi:riboflavin synthase
MVRTIGVIDTTFARVNMGQLAVAKIQEITGQSAKIIRRTVPGIKDLPGQARILFDAGCAVILAMGMPGPKPIDKTCAHEASMGLIQLQILLGKHIIECFVYEDEAESLDELKAITIDRTLKHAEHAARIVQEDWEWFIQRAGKGFRQGHKDAGEI